MAFVAKRNNMTFTSRAFRNSKQLQAFLLSDVTPTGKVLGTGSYGAVEELHYNQLKCAGKKIHEILLEQTNEGVDDLVTKYLKECQLMASLRHPNITQFLGLCFLPETKLPVLVMELLETSLNDLLQNIPNIPLPLQCGILEDVCNGLVYLHTRTPPVIHRDLTAGNVILTSSLVAKITDMGNSRIADLRPEQMAKTLSHCPGTLVYMPPEALDSRHRYGTSLDMFSFGILALFTLTQVFPGNLLPSTFYSPELPSIIQGRTEIERRQSYIDALEGKFGWIQPALVHLIKQCLHNIPTVRPVSDDCLTRLKEIRTQVEGEHGHSLGKLDIFRVRLVRDLKMKDRRIRDLTQQVVQLFLE